LRYEGVDKGGAKSIIGGMKEIDKLAEAAYEYCCSHRQDNIKDDVGGNPRNVGCPFAQLYDNAKEFYRNIARWHLEKSKHIPSFVHTGSFSKGGLT
jgi:hypothetical protein